MDMDFPCLTRYYLNGHLYREKRGLYHGKLFLLPARPMRMEYKTDNTDRELHLRILHVL